jgi:CheY-like chemotaxis protein
VREPDAPPEPAKVTSKVEHDLANSLAAIVGFSEVIRRDPTLPEDLRQNADLLQQEAKRTQDLVRHLLEIARARTPEPRPTPEPAATTRAAPSTTARPRILVLDDEPSMRLFLEKALDLLGYEPEVSAQGIDAIQRATDGDHAAFLFDHQMAGMSGVDTCEAILAVRPELAGRIVLMSGDLLQPDLEALAARHAIKLLAKPFDLDTLDGAIRAAMDATGQRG